MAQVGTGYAGGSAGALTGAGRDAEARIQEVNSALERLAIKFQRLMQLFSSAVNGASSPTSSRAACDTIQTQWHEVQNELSTLQRVTGALEGDARLYMDELDRIIAELSYGQGDPREHRTQFPFFALKVLSGIKIAVKVYIDQCASGALAAASQGAPMSRSRSKDALLEAPTKAEVLLSNSTLLKSLSSEKPGGLAPLVQRSEPAPAQATRRPSQPRQVQGLSPIVQSAGSGGSLSPNPSGYATLRPVQRRASNGVSQEGHLNEGDRSKREEELARIVNEKRGVVKQAVGRLETAFSPTAIAAPNFNNPRFMGVSRTGTAATQGAPDATTESPEYLEAKSQPDGAVDANTGNQGSVAAGRVSQSNTFHTAKQELEAVAPPRKPSITTGSNPPTWSQTPPSPGHSLSRGNVLAEQERNLYELHRQQQQYLQQQQLLEEQQLQSRQQQTPVSAHPAAGLSNSLGYSHLAAAANNGNNANMSVPISDTRFYGSSSAAGELGAKDADPYAYPEPPKNAGSEPQLRHAAGDESNGQLEMSAGQDEQLESWIQAVPPQQVQYDNSPASLAPETEAQIGPTFVGSALPAANIGNRFVETVQVVLVPLNGMFDTGYLNLTIPNRLGRHNGTGHPRFLAFPSQVVSRNHMEIWSDKNKVLIRDIGSMSGTFLNGERLSEPGKQSGAFEIKSGDRIRLGKDFVEEKNMGDPAFVPEVRYRSVKMKVLIMPKHHTPAALAAAAAAADSAVGNQYNPASGRLPNASGDAGAPGVPLERNMAGGSSNMLLNATVLSSAASGLSRISYIATMVEQQSRIKEIQLTPSAPSSPERAVTYSANLKQWESKRKILVEEFNASSGRVTMLEITRDPINEQLYNVTTEMGAFAGSIQNVNEIKVQLNLPIAGNISPSLTLTGDFKECKFFVILKSNQSREQRCIGESIARSPMRTGPAGSSSNGSSHHGTLRLGVLANSQRWMYQFEFEDGDWTRLLMLANIFVSVAHHS